MKDTKPREPRPVWTTPRIECLETRPEVTAYSGDADPWTRKR
jgi:hypothetical protein